MSDDIIKVVRRDLLKKYMGMILREEGVSYLHNSGPFTKEEWEELKHIELEIIE